MRKIIKNKKMGILMIGLILNQVQVQAGWFSGFGDRLINGVVNTVQSNISRKANKTVDDVMDGNIKPSSKKQSKTEVKVQKESNSMDVNNNSVTKPITNMEEVETFSYRGTKGRVIPFTGKYELINLGTTKFTGEKIYSNLLRVGEVKKEINEFLAPGYYLISVIPGSRTEPIAFFFDREVEGITFGYGIEVRQMLKGLEEIEMLLGRDEIKYVVEVLPNTQGNLEVTLVNNEKRSGSGEISIFKIPGPTLK